MTQQYWIFKMRSDLARTYISGLRRFYDEGEMHFNIGVKDLGDETDHFKPEEWDSGEGDHYIDLHGELEESRELTRDFSIVGLFRVFEKFLRDTLRHLLRTGPDRAKRDPRDQWSLAEMKEIFKEIGVPVTKPDGDWNSIKKLQAIRNCIVHSGGRADKQRTKKLERYKIPVDQSKMVLPDGYFEKSADLIERVCKRIAKDCGTAVKEKRIKSRSEGSALGKFFKVIVTLLLVTFALMLILNLLGWLQAAKALLGIE